MNERLVIFDFDGVIVDTEELNYQANEKTFSPLDISFTRQTYARKWIIEGLDMEDITREFNLNLSGQELRNVKNSHYNEILDTSLAIIEPIKGIREAITKLLSLNYRLAIVSSNSRKNIDRIIQHFGLGGSFELIIGREDVQAPKPDPEPFLLCLNRLSTIPENALVIEDSIKGLKSAKLAGISNLVAFPNEWTRESDFTLASTIISSAYDIPNTVRNLLKN